MVTGVVSGAQSLSPAGPEPLRSRSAARDRVESPRWRVGAEPAVVRCPPGSRPEPGHPAPWRLPREAVPDRRPRDPADGSARYSRGDKAAKNAGGARQQPWGHPMGAFPGGRSRGALAPIGGSRHPGPAPAPRSAVHPAPPRADLTPLFEGRASPVRPGPSRPRTRGHVTGGGTGRMRCVVLTRRAPPPTPASTCRGPPCDPPPHRLWILAGLYGPPRCSLWC